MPQQSSYKLTAIRALIRAKQVRINSNAANDALNSFGWKEGDILKAVASLTAVHFHKTEEHRAFSPVMMDYYKARNFLGVNLYTHFYVRDGVLVVSSFKPI